MYSIIIVGPVFMFLILSFFGRFLGGFYTALAVCLSTLIAGLLSVDALIFILNAGYSLTYHLPIFSFFVVGFIDFHWHFYFDSIVLFIYCLITVVSFFIQVFSVSYMGEDASHVRFIIYLCFFMIAMLILVGSANFLQMFFGWELVGLASFLLINFWFARQDANIAAFKAVAVNRFGDCALLLAMMFYLSEFQTFEFDLLFSLSLNNLFIDSFWHSCAFFFVVVGCFAKSAQFFFHTWLPDAMEGPTPVSALLHSATIVTAGVFIILRFVDFLEYYPFIRFVVVFFGLLTALYAMSIAAVADDTKRTTAYTTLNQLGFMFFGCGSLAVATVLFHLVVHGFYKSFSFLSAAIELHDLEDEQDGEFDQLDLTTGNTTVYDLFTSLVFISVNAIPFSSPSISKEFLLLTGIEQNSSYFTFLICLTLFSSPVDEGRDDPDDTVVTGYVDDLYVSSYLPNFMFCGAASLGGLSILSATCLEEVFIDLDAFWFSSSINWIDVHGTLLIFLPFLSLILSEFAFSVTRNRDDLFVNSIHSRADTSYQAVLFNAELWYYDEFQTIISKLVLIKSYSFTNRVMDRGYLEELYVGTFRFLGFWLRSTYSVVGGSGIEQILFKSVFFSFFLVSSAFIFSANVFGVIVILALFYFVCNITVE